MAASVATSSRRRAATRRAWPPVGRPASVGLSSARRALRKSPSSLRWGSRVMAASLVPGGDLTDTLPGARPGGATPAARNTWPGQPDEDSAEGFDDLVGQRDRRGRVLAGEQGAVHLEVR